MNTVGFLLGVPGFAGHNVIGFINVLCILRLGCFSGATLRLNVGRPHEDLRLTKPSLPSNGYAAGRVRHGLKWSQPD